MQLVETGKFVFFEYKIFLVVYFWVEQVALGFRVEIFEVGQRAANDALLPPGFGFYDVRHVGYTGSGLVEIVAVHF